ncbi:ribosomal RNA small subunit methyltransferase A [bacterium]|nr:ribosomal RNA small subunit methyltransferase A [FCB group bacterium]MBL7191503.1 ribosomal RNA small subunit methyltransferase A [bacterium]
MRKNGWPPPKKSLGQSLLVDADFAYQLIECLNLQSNDKVLEIGPGRGILTDYILKKGADLICCEIDQRMVEVLKHRFEEGAKFRIIHQDILELDLEEIFPGEKYQAVGNLPYHLTSGILFKFFNYIRKSWDMGNILNVSSLTVMIQKEVADRILSKPGGSLWSILSIFSDLYSTREKLLDVPPEVFRPKPKVDSAFIKFSFRNTYPFPIKNFAEFDKIIRLSIGQRRKMLKNTLSQYKFPSDFTEILKRRPQELSLQDFIRLAEAAETG